MRTVLLGLSVCFFAAAAVITAAALSLPDRTPPPPAPAPPAADTSREVGEMLGRLAEKQAASNALVTDLRREIVALQREIARKEREKTADRDKGRRALEKENKRILTELKESLAAERARVEDPAGEAPGKPPSPGRSGSSAVTVPARSDGEAADGRGTLIAILGGGDFGPGQDLITPLMEAAVQTSLPAIVTNPESSVSVEGHTDNVPLGKALRERFGDNRALSLLRAKAVADVLEKAGVDRSRITYAGYGGTRPIAPNSTPEGRAENRRVEIRLVPPADARQGTTAEH
jgi:chemotaxis protein MotB